MSSFVNPFAALIQTDNINNKSSIFEDIFGFTLNRYVMQNRPLVYLEDVNQALGTNKLNLDTLEHALCERLFLSNPREHLINSDASTTNELSEITNHKVITYLFYCYHNVVNCTTIDDASKKRVVDLIMRNAITALQQPDLYDGQDVTLQLFNLIKNGVTLALNFFTTIYENSCSDSEQFEVMKTPFTNLLHLTRADIVKSSITTLCPSLWDILIIYSTHSYLADILLDYCKPKEPVEAGITYCKTLFGALLCLSILPKSPAGNYEFFTNPLDNADTVGMEPVLWTYIDRLTENTQKIFLNLLKLNPELRQKTLSWLGSCLKANSDRAKLWNAQAPELNPVTYSSASDAFMINFSNVLLRLCNPFCANIEDRKILKVDPTYCAVPNEHCNEKGIHLLDMSKETCLVPHEDTDGNQERPCAETYGFVTECFYMAHRSVELGYKVTVDKLTQLNLEISRIERAYNDAVSQGRRTNDVIDVMKDRMKAEMTKYLSMKSVLSEPNLVTMLFNFVCASSYWLIQIALHAELRNDQTYAPVEEIEVKLPIPDVVPDTLKCIPEFVVENIVCFLVFLRRFNPNVFEEKGFECLKPILTFIVTYMGSSEKMKNPHLRARLAEALETILPDHKNDPPGLNKLGDFQRHRLFKEYTYKQEVVRNLLRVFVSIEMTGQSVQFEQKFNYRRPMYMVMDYLWELEEYQQHFVKLAEESERDMDAVSPPLFLRFVNLLMNDAVFLLDEALSNMAQLREMQAARENGEWDNIQPNERTQNLSYMQHIGDTARFDNILGKYTIRTLEHLTSKITIVFTHSSMVDRVAAMLNYFLYKLVGPKKKNFKVKDQKEYSFDPADTVLNICKICVHLSKSDLFCAAVSQDGRSYSPQLFKLAEDVLIRIGGGALVSELQEVALKVAEKSVEYQTNEEILQGAPEQFLDPIMSTLMLDPVILPSSKQTVDRSTIARHLLSDQSDPFNRAPLTMDQVIPNTALSEEINKWLASRRAT